MRTCVYKYQCTVCKHTGDKWINSKVTEGSRLCHCLRHCFSCVLKDLNSDILTTTSIQVVDAKTLK